MQRKFTLLDSLNPGRYHKRDFEVKPPHGIIQGQQGRYMVLKQFAEGGTSRVKKLENIETHEQRVLKIIYAHEKFCEIAAKEAYDKEYRILTLLKRIDPVIIETKSKKNITKHQIVMDLAKGIELYELLFSDNEEICALLPRDNPKKLLQIGLNLLVDLYAIHQVGILLIDDKIENIIVDPVTLEVSRIDFGLAEDNYDFTKNTGFNTLGFRGTITTAAPEVLTAGYNRTTMTFDHSTDMYSVGVILKSLLMGYYYYEKPRTPPYAFSRQDLSNVLKAYPQIEALILKMTSAEAPNRPSSLVEVIEAFEEALKLEKGSSLDKLNKKTPIENEHTSEAKRQP